MQVGIVGVGFLGQRIADSLVAEGHGLALFDPHPSPTAHDEGRGVRWVADPAECGNGKDAVLVAVRTPGQVEQVVLAPRAGLLSAHSRPRAIIVCSTVSPATTERVAQACADAGVRFIDAPVNGRPPELVVFAGARSEDLDFVRPVLGCISKAVHQLGGPGSGTRAKLLHQVVLYANHLHATAALEVGQRAGIDPDALMAGLLDSSAYSKALAGLAARRHGTTGPTASINLIAKDMRLAAEMIESLDIDWPGARELFDTYARAQSAGLGAQEFDTVRLILGGENASLAEADPTATSPPTI